MNGAIKGFTLIELIVTIAIIGVLAAILVPSMLGYVGDSKLSTANANAKLVYTNSATYGTKCSVAGYVMDESCSIEVPTSIRRDGSEPAEVKAPTSTPDSDMLLAALKILMGSSSANSGFVEVKVAAAGMPKSASWAKSATDKFVGNYPTESTASGEAWACEGN